MGAVGALSAGVRWTPYLSGVDRPPGPAAVAAVEAAAGVRLPADYLACLAANQGRTPEPNVVPLPGGGTDVLGVLLTCGARDDYGVAAALDTWRDGGMPAGLVPFAETPGGNVLAFDFRAAPDAPTVAWIGHEDDPGRPVPLAPGFSALLAMLRD